MRFLVALPLIAAVLVAAGARGDDAPATPGDFGIPDPAEPQTHIVAERGESPEYYRLPGKEVGTWVRLGVGGEKKLSIGGEDDPVRFSFDALVGAQVGGRQGAWEMVTELGYSYVYGSEDWFVLGLGPGLRGIGASGPNALNGVGLTLIPHGIVGNIDNSLAYGVRTSLVLRFYTAGIEVAHQFARVPELDRNVHEIHFMFTPVMAMRDY